MPRHGIVILAAGASSRLGHPKQLLQHQGRTLLARVIDAATSAQCGPVAIVIGAWAEEIQSTELKAAGAGADPPLVVSNPDWRRGIGTSIRAGVSSITRTHPALQGVLLLLCDQPLVDSGCLRRLLDAADASAKPICAAQYAGAVGTPAWFSHALFDDLLALGDDAGGKSLIRRDLSRVLAVPMPEAAFDIDTAAQWEQFTGKPRSAAQ